MSTDYSERQMMDDMIELRQIEAMTAMQKKLGKQEDYIEKLTSQRNFWKDKAVQAQKLLAVSPDETATAGFKTSWRAERDQWMKPANLFSDPEPDTYNKGDK